MPVILLNGPSSAGKSSIVRALIARMPEACSVALDDYLPMSKDEPIWEDDVFDVMPSMADALRRTRADIVIIDHVITSPRIYQSLLDALAGQDIIRVLVSCDLETLRARELARGNRCVGSAEASLAYLYPKSGYDLTVDSTVMKPEQIAESIESYVKGRVS